MVVPLDTPIASIPRMVTHDGSKSAKSARILSPLPSSVHDSTDPLSGWIRTRLYSFFARYRTIRSVLSDFVSRSTKYLLAFREKEMSLTML